jgi:hypothetical protein
MQKLAESLQNLAFLKSDIFMGKPCNFRSATSLQTFFLALVFTCIVECKYRKLFGKPPWELTIV